MPEPANITEMKAASPTKASEIMPFKSILAQHDLKLVRQATTTLQINLGFLCNQTCRHCHLNAGPARKKENMDGQTLKDAALKPSTLPEAHRNSIRCCLN
jgi:sulfatase maturation enzyme AslB (radical SAM superfamily)